MVRTRGQRKQMTSAIPEMTVAEVRRALLEIRTRWKDTTGGPFILSQRSPF
jgi:hypothetical protein